MSYVIEYLDCNMSATLPDARHLLIAEQIPQSQCRASKGHEDAVEIQVSPPSDKLFRGSGAQDLASSNAGHFYHEWVVS